MKTFCPVLVIASVCCFATVLSNAIRDSKDKKNSGGEPSCLEKAMTKSEKTCGRVIKFLCTYVKSKDMPDKADLVEAIHRLEDDTGCKDIFGTSESPEQLAMDENGVLAIQIPKMKHLLEQRGISLFSVEAMCVLLNKCTYVTPTSNEDTDQENKRTKRGLEIGQLLGLGNLAPGLLDTVLGLSGGLLGGLSGGLVGGGTNANRQGNLLGQVLGGKGGPLGLLNLQGLLGGLLNGPVDLLGGVLGSSHGNRNGALAGGIGGLLGQGSDGLPGRVTGGQDPGNLLGSLLGAVGGLTGTFTG